MHIFVVEYSTSYGFQCVCNSNEEKNYKITISNTKATLPFAIITVLSNKAFVIDTRVYINWNENFRTRVFQIFCSWPQISEYFLLECTQNGDFCEKNGESCTNTLQSTLISGWKAFKGRLFENWKLSYFWKGSREFLHQSFKTSAVNILTCQKYAVTAVRSKLNWFMFSLTSPIYIFK